MNWKESSHTRLAVLVFGLTVLLTAAVLMLPVAAGGKAGAGSKDRDPIRWDIVTLNFAEAPVTARAGGISSALAQDGSRITITGTGTFVPGRPRAVTGGGTWRAVTVVGAPIGSGTYEVSRLVHWESAPGTFPITDGIGDPAEAAAGHVTLKIEYSDGSIGVLVVSCRLAGTPGEVFEGITASKGFVTYYDRVAEISGVDANRTLFHVPS